MNNEPNQYLPSNPIVPQRGVNDQDTKFRKGRKNNFACLPWGLGALVVILFSFNPGFSQTMIYSAASTAVPLDYLEGSARDLALGSAFVGIADDSSAIFFNSAGLSGLQNPEVSLNHNS